MIMMIEVKLLLVLHFHKKCLQLWIQVVDSSLLETPFQEVKNTKF